MHLVLSAVLCVQIDPWRFDRPYCCQCSKPVDWFGQKLELDKMMGSVDDDILKSQSYRRIFVVRCHEETGMVHIDWGKWSPMDERPTPCETIVEHA